MTDGEARGRFLGCLLGGALGDALGAPIEFDEDHVAIVGRHGAGPPARLAYAGPARITDDTQMTMFVTEGLIRALERWREKGICNPHAVGLRALLRWFDTQHGVVPEDGEGWLVRDRRLHARRAPGATCLSALAARVTAAGGELGPASNSSKGCGGVMRAAPFGLALEAERAFEHAVTNAAFTHGHPTGSLAAGYLAAVIAGLARGHAVEVTLAAADALLAGRPRHEETARAVASARRLAGGKRATTPASLERLGGGWVAEEALAIGLACFLQHDPARSAVAETLWRAACHGGDSDSTASIAGNLLGAALGVDALPAAWLAELELADAIERLAADLWASYREDRRLDPDDYPGW